MNEYFEVIRNVFAVIGVLCVLYLFTKFVCDLSCRIGVAHDI